MKNEKYKLPFGGNSVICILLFFIFNFSFLQNYFRMIHPIYLTNTMSP